MRIGIGLGLFLFFGFLLNLARVPLDWRIFLGASILILAVRLFVDYRKKELFSFKVNFNLYSILMLVLFFATLYMYITGAFAYPYLEDDDSWSHAIGVKFVSMEKTVFAGKNSVFHYIDPYPPAYDMFMGIIHQTNDSVYWTLKFFNALLVSLPIIFFFYFTKSLARSSRKAFYSAFVLFAIPAFMSHFIWSIAITMPLFFISFYCIGKVNDDKNWWILSALVIMPTITSSPTHSTYFGFFLIIYFVARLIVERKFLIYEFFAGATGIILSFLLWWIPTIMTHGFSGVIRIIGPAGGPRAGYLSIEGTSDRVYSLSDFLCNISTPCYNGQNMINSPIGIGIIVSVLCVVGLFLLFLRQKEAFKNKNYYFFVAVIWFFFSFYAVNSSESPVKLSPFRTWMLFAIPVALMAAEAINFIYLLIKSLSSKLIKKENIVLGVSAFLIVGLGYSIFVTSFAPKYKVNTANWPPGAFWASTDEIQGYIWFKDNIPAQSKVFTFSNNGLIIGLDKFICHWCPDVRDFQSNGIGKSPDEIYSWLKKNDYKYLIVDGQTVKKFGINETNRMIVNLGSGYNLQPVFRNNGIIILKI